jgi:hypothetical protein
MLKPNYYGFNIKQSSTQNPTQLYYNLTKNSLMNIIPILINEILNQNIKRKDLTQQKDDMILLETSYQSQLRA